LISLFEKQILIIFDSSYLHRLLCYEAL